MWKGLNTMPMKRSGSADLGAAAVALRKSFSVGLIVIGTLTSAAGQAATSRTAPIGKFSGVDEVIEVCTTSTAFVPIPGATRTFTLGGTTADEVVVMFQGAFSLDEFGPAFDTGFIRLTIDGVVQGPGDQVPAKQPEGGTSTHGFNWQTRSLRPGIHTARVLWRTDQGSTFCVDTRSLIILHK